MSESAPYFAAAYLRRLKPWNIEKSVRGGKIPPLPPALLLPPSPYNFIPMLRRSDVKYFEKPEYNLSYLFFFLPDSSDWAGI